MAYINQCLLQMPDRRKQSTDSRIGLPMLNLFKGKVARDFRPPFFPRIHPIQSSNSHPKIFLNSVSNSPKYSYLNVVPRGLIPCKTLFCVVRYPARLKFQGVWYTAGSCSAPQNKILRGIRPCWQIKTPWNQIKKFWELAILFKGTLLVNRLDV